MTNDENDAWKAGYTLGWEEGRAALELWQAEGIDAIRERIDLVVDTALSCDHGVGDVDEGAVVCRFGDRYVAVISHMLDLRGRRERVSDVHNAIEIARDANEEWGYYSWLDEVAPLYRLREQEE